MNALITMSGGTTTVINAMVAGIVTGLKSALFKGKIFAGLHGISGLLDQRLADLSEMTEPKLSRLRMTPASGFIGTSRLEVFENERIEEIAKHMRSNRISFHFNIGGNGTIQQSKQLAEHIGDEVNIIALPKTVDNDFGDEEFEKVMFTPGFPSCVNYWRHKINIFNQENLGAQSHDKVLVLQTFGRKTGFICGSMRYADPERSLPLLLLLPEDQKPIDNVIGAINNMVQKHNRALVGICEGYRIDDIGEYEDLSGQTMYGSSREMAAQQLVNKLMENEVQSRAFIPGFDQRDEILLSCDVDNALSYKLGRTAAELSLDGRKNILVSTSNQAVVNDSSQYTATALSEIGDFNRHMPRQWLNRGNFDVSDGYVQYLDKIMRNMSSLHHKPYLLKPFISSKLTK